MDLYRPSVPSFVFFRADLNPTMLKAVVNADQNTRASLTSHTLYVSHSYEQQMMLTTLF